jgi:hypothetical protein
MQKLIGTGLYGAGLIEINSTKLIGRYNRALKAMGLETTKLTTFSIDAIGWSPEISDEMENVFYLSHSLANPMAIIITIDQKNAPIYFPYHSFDRVMMSNIYEQFSAQIMDITTKEAIWIDLDNGVSRYRYLRDLLLIDSIDVHMETPGKTINAANEQKKLAIKFLQEENAWEDETLRKNIIDSATNHGNLYSRNISMSKMHFSDIHLFFTKALSGVYVLRSPFDINDKDVVFVCEDKQLAKTESKNSKHAVFHIDEKKLVEHLISKGYLKIDLEFYRSNIELLDMKKDFILAEVLCAQNDNIDYCSLNSAQKKSFITQYEDIIPETFFEIESLEKQLNNGDKVNIHSLPHELRNILLLPGDDIPEKFHRVIYRLLSFIDTTNPVIFYSYNKSNFYDAFKDFSESKKLWVSTYIKEEYLNKKQN